jgi:hypothetical protein
MFNPGDRVVCVDNSFDTRLKLGEKFEIVSVYYNYTPNSDLLLLVNDNIEYDDALKLFDYRFILDIKEQRKQKLKKLCLKLEIE